MTDMWKTLAACAAAGWLVACSVAPSQMIVEARTSYDGAMERATAHMRAQRWEDALHATRSAIEALPFHDGKGVEDGNFAYLKRQAQALEAYLTLASGATEAAEQMYQTLFESVRAGEAEREEEFKRRAGSAQVWEALTFAVFTGARAERMGIEASDTIALGLQSFGQALDRPAIAPIDVNQLSSLANEDDGVRITVMPSVGPFGRIGRLVTAQGTCTASLVGDALALTNAHCVTAVQERDDRLVQGSWAVRGGDMQVVWEGTYAPDRVRVTSVTLNGGDRWNLNEDGDFSDDWAILHLERHPVGRGWFGILDEETMETEGVFVAGYSGDLNDGRLLTVDWGCKGTTQVDSPMLYHSCESAPGASGSPILRTAGAYRLDYVVGLHAFRREADDGTWDGGGPKSSRFREAVRIATNQGG